MHLNLCIVYVCVFVCLRLYGYHYMTEVGRGCFTCTYKKASYVVQICIGVCTCTAICLYGHSISMIVLYVFMCVYFQVHVCMYISLECIRMSMGMYVHVYVWINNACVDVCYIYIILLQTYVPICTYACSLQRLPDVQMLYVYEVVKKKKNQRTDRKLHKEEVR